jgi:hypothetical protein
MAGIVKTAKATEHNKNAARLFVPSVIMFSPLLIKAMHPV